MNKKYPRLYEHQLAAMQHVITDKVATLDLVAPETSTTISIMQASKVMSNETKELKGNRDIINARLAACQDYDVKRGQYANLCISNSDYESMVGHIYARIGHDADTVYDHILSALGSTSAAHKMARGHKRVSLPYHSVVFPDVAFAAPFIRSKKLFLRPMLRELLWFLMGETNIEYLKHHNVHIWDGWVDPATARYEMLTWVERVRIMHKENKHVGWEAFRTEHPDDLEAQAKWMDDRGIPTQRLVAGELGPVYGAQWRGAEDIIVTKTTSSDLTNEVRDLLNRGYRVIGRDHSGYMIMQGSIDQLGNALNLLQTDPGSSRMLVNAWHPGQVEQMRLPPCHFALQFVVGRHVKAALMVPYDSEHALENARHIGRGMIADDIVNETQYLHLNVVQRSCDIPLGIPFNWASYSTLLLLIGEISGIPAGSLNYTMHDVHYYENQNQNGEFKQLHAQYRTLAGRHQQPENEATLEKIHAQIPRLKIVIPAEVKAVYAANPDMSIKGKLDAFLDVVADFDDNKLFEVFQYNYVDPMPEIKFPVSI